MMGGRKWPSVWWKAELRKTRGDTRRPIKVRLEGGGAVFVCIRARGPVYHVSAKPGRFTSKFDDVMFPISRTAQHHRVRPETVTMQTPSCFRIHFIWQGSTHTTQYLTVPRRTPQIGMIVSGCGYEYASFPMREQGITDRNWVFSSCIWELLSDWSDIWSGCGRWSKGETLASTSFLERGEHCAQSTWWQIHDKSEKGVYWWRARVMCAAVGWATTNSILALSNTFLYPCRVRYTLILTCYVSEPVQCCHLIKNHFQRRQCAEMTAAVMADKEKEEQSIAASAESLCYTQLEAFLMGLFDMCIHFAVV